jgi:hypothetical protein
MQKAGVLRGMHALRTQQERLDEDWCRMYVLKLAIALAYAGAYHEALDLMLEALVMPHTVRFFVFACPKVSGFF